MGGMEQKGGDSGLQNAMKARRLSVVWLVMCGWSTLSAQPARAADLTPAGPERWQVASNRAVMVIASMRGIAPDEVKFSIKPGHRVARYELDLRTATNMVLEAEALSKELGQSFAVVTEEISPDGLMRTNRTFRSGIVQQVIAPASGTGLAARARRLSVFPEGSRPQAPGNVRIAPQ